MKVLYQSDANTCPYTSGHNESLGGVGVGAFIDTHVEIALTVFQFLWEHFSICYIIWSKCDEGRFSYQIL